MESLHVSKPTRLFDERNPNWTREPTHNHLFLKGVQNHMNNLLAYRGHLFLNEVYDALSYDRTRDGVLGGWFLDQNLTLNENYIDFGIEELEDGRFKLSFNIDEEPIYERLANGEKSQREKSL